MIIDTILKFIILILIFIFFRLFRNIAVSYPNNFPNDINTLITKNFISELSDMQEYISMASNGESFNAEENNIYYKSINPKISIVIGVFNGEGYINNTLLSIQNQDFKDIEIIMVDDGSRDNSYNVIKELQKKDQRINYQKNE